MEAIRFENLSPVLQRSVLTEPGYLPDYQQVVSAFRGEESRYAWIKFCSSLGTERASMDILTRDILTVEYVGALAHYLSARAGELRRDSRALKVLEVEAREARLAYFLRQKVDPHTLHYHASNSERLNGAAMVRDLIDGVKIQTALSEIKPDIVICSWMPSKQDLTALFRREPSVQEYILIGEANSGCGDEWLTWGRYDLYEHERDIPPYKADGFVREDLTAVDGNWHVCINDASPESPYRSSTVSFRREQ